MPRQSPSPPRARSVSMRTGLTVGVIAAVALTAAIVHFPWSATSRNNIADLNARLNAQVIRGIAEKVDGLLDNAVAARQAIATNLIEGVVDIGDRARREFLFLSFLQSQPALSAIEFGAFDNHSFLARRADDGSIRMEEVEQSASGGTRRTDIYGLAENGMLIFDRREEEPRDYRVSEQFWFLTAFDATQPAWSNIYPMPATGMLGVTTTRAIERKGDLLGVLGVSISLDRLSSFLDGIEIGGSSAVFLTNVYSELVALQRPVPNLAGRVDPAASIRKLDQVDQPAVRLVVDALAANGVALETLDSTRQLTYRSAATGETYFITLAPLAQMGLITSVVIPESEILGAINRNTQLLLAALAAFILLTGLAATLIARRLIGAPLAQVTDNLRQLEDFRLDRVAHISSHFSEVQQVSAATMRMSASLASFKKYIPTELVRTLFAQGIEAELGGERRELSILFMDIAGFTRIAEQHGDRLVELLGDYLSEMSTVIQGGRGTIDKYIGDAIMAFWGAPVSDADHAVAACRAALDCQMRLMRMRADSRAAGFPELHARIGINSGTVMVGNFGSRDRLNYTVIGDPVNVASRLEALNKRYGTGIIIGERTRALAGERIVVRPLDRVAVYGKVQGIEAFELLAMGDDPVLPAFDWIAAYQHGRDALRDRRWDDAIAAFERTIALRGADPVSRLQIDRARELRTNPPAADWDGSLVLDMK